MRLVRRPLLLASLFAVVFLVFHLRYLPESLDDVDAINFALGIHQFDVTQHQPHPPGYPVYISLAKIARTAMPSDASALALLSAIAGTLGVIAVTLLFRFIAADDEHVWTMMAAAVAVSCPLYWFTAVRPLSDSVGLTAAVVVQAMTIGATTARGIAVAAFCAGVATGIRSQVFWLTVPLLIWSCGPDPFGFGSRRRSLAGPEGPALRAAGGFGIGVLTWFLPLILLSGGIRGYWQALFGQGSEDLTGVRMLWTTRTPRMLAEALYYAFIAPWALWAVAVTVLILAAAGIAVLARRNRRALVVAAVAFGPYVLFDLVFHEAVTGRYALPIVLPVAFFAAAAITTLPRYVAVAGATALVMFNAHTAGRTVAAYSRQPAPAFRMLADMRAAAGASAVKPVLAPDRRQSFDLRRSLKYLGADAPSFDRQLSAPPQHEWLEAAKYWDAGGRAPVWFVVDPRRAAIDLVQHGEPRTYEWSVPRPVLISGTRPNDLRWYAVDRPEWYVGPGWALTPEAAGVSEKDRPSAPSGAVRRDVAIQGALVIGGRNFGKTDGKVALFLDSSSQILSSAVAPGAFLYLIRLSLDLAGTADYVRLSAAVDTPADIALEQFDASATRGILGFGSGWHERELNPSTGRLWRWLSERGELRYVAPEGWNLLRISGESPKPYYSKPSRLVVKSGDRVLHDSTVTGDFTISVKIPASAAPSTVTVETDQTHVPADRSWRGSQDRRRLGLRIFSCELQRVFEPGTATNSPQAR